MRNLYLLENIEEKEIANIVKDKDADIVAFDYESHTLLLRHNIKHQTIDDCLDDVERRKIFQFCLSLQHWYDRLDHEELKFHGINLLSIIDRNETHEVLMNIVPKIYAVKKAIKESQPSLIFASNKILDLFVELDNKIRPISGTSDLDDNFTHDKINISYELKGISIGIRLSRKKYEFVKRNFEKIICSAYGLRKARPDRKKIILIEFNPEASSDLLKEIDKQRLQPFLINFRRSATWSRNSITQLRRSHSLVGISEDWMDKENSTAIRTNRDMYLQRIHSVFANEGTLSGIFVFEGVRFDQYMKKSFLKVLDDRLDEYFRGIFLAESLIKSNDVAGIITLNLSGETEKVFSRIATKIPVVILQHAFSNYTQQISYLDVLDDFDLIKDRVAVWGNIVKEYLVKVRMLSEDKIIVTGNPKYDSFVRREKKKNHKKTILVTPRPIINHIEGIRIETYGKYERTIDKILETIEVRNDIEIIFKLHPQQSRHNETIKEYIKSKNQDIKIYQFKPISQLLAECDLHVNVAPDNFDASTVMLEAMILGRPTINIQLQNTEIEFEFMKDKAVKTVSYDSDVKGEIFELLYNEDRIDELIKNATTHLKRYLANHGTASQTLVTEIKKISNKTTDHSSSDL